MNAGGRIKLAGLAQRIGRKSYHMGVVISALPSALTSSAVAEAYRNLGMEFSPGTFGAATEATPLASSAAVSAAVKGSLAACLEIEPKGLQSAAC